MLEKTLKSHLDRKKIKPVNPKGNQSWIFVGRTDAEAPILWAPDVINRLIGKDPHAGEDLRQEDKGMTEDEMVAWYHRLDGHEFEQALGIGDGQGSLGCCNPWGLKESDTTELLKWTELNFEYCRITLFHLFWSKDILLFLTNGLRYIKKFSSVQFSWSVRSDSLWPHELQHPRPPCPSPNHVVYANSWSLGQWFHPTISSSVIPFSSRLQSFPASGSFPRSQCFQSGGQIIGVSALASVLPMNIQDWFPLGLTGWISLLSKGLSSVFANTIGQKHQFFSLSFLYSQLSHSYRTSGRNIDLTRGPFVGR